ncbi:hypothetical protein [Weissella cibaria]|uniref:hypothetical protein n=1 Tax=Weissella cibaria TaxID=137591 RepID=UPI00142F7110|nr:hypothetical protein [Weissella cibaria]
MNEVGWLEKIMAVCKSKWVLGVLVVGVSASAAVSGWNGATNMNTVTQVLGQLDEKIKEIQQKVRMVTVKLN